MSKKLTGLKIVRAIGKEGGKATIGQIARRLGKSKGYVKSFLKYLENVGALIKENDYYQKTDKEINLQSVDWETVRKNKSPEASSKTIHHDLGTAKANSKVDEVAIYVVFYSEHEVTDRLFVRTDVKTVNKTKFFYFERNLKGFLDKADNDSNIEITSIVKIKGIEQEYKTELKDSESINEYDWLFSPYFRN